MSWFKREDNQVVNDQQKTVRTERFCVRCPSAKEIGFKADIIAANQQACKCGLYDGSAPASALTWMTGTPTTRTQHLSLT
jgi:hypothetical protein